ncbi:MAG TPA: TIGR01906 family membrane protein [Chloroflexi bacterium]|nr:TIGR01906 family membrane protein [Chloroflexota bacterium]
MKTIPALRSVLVISIPFFLLLSNLYLLFSPSFIDYEYSKGSWPLPPRYDDHERREVAEAVLYYLRSKEEISYLGELADEGGPLFNERELIHLVDVKVLARRALLLHGVLGLLIVGAVVILLFYPKGRRVLPGSLLQGSLLTFLLFGLVGVFAAAGFDTFFVGFHRTFFEGDSWLFSPYDTLIQLFPLPFWFDAAITWVGLTLGEAAILGVGAYLWGRSSVAP